MKDLASIPRTNGAFPDVTTIADTAPQSKDGTPMTKNLFDDMFGFYQAILVAAGVTPNASAETAGATAPDISGSQLLAGIQAAFRPAGEVAMYLSDTIPTGARLLKLDGQTVLRATYPNLVANIEQPFVAGNSFFRCDVGGGSNPTTGLYMKLPDWDGVSARGRDAGSNFDPDGGTRMYGDVQATSGLKHNHVIETESSKEYAITLSSGGAVAGEDIVRHTTNKASADVEASAVDIGTDITGFANITGVGKMNSESIPNNFMVQWCITY